MLENAACQAGLHALPLDHHDVRGTLRTLALRLLESEVSLSEGILAAKGLLNISQLMTTELREWSVILRDNGYQAATLSSMSNQQLLSWAMVRFGKNHTQLHKYE
jgi:hypothetical protein